MTGTICGTVGACWWNAVTVSCKEVGEEGEVVLGL